jgi:hypothetical protein
MIEEISAGSEENGETNQWRGAENGENGQLMAALAKA